MRCRWLCRAAKFLVLPLWLLAGSAMAASAAPTLFRVTSAKPALLAHGAHKSWPIKFDENAAMDAVFQGGMWLPNPEGGRIYAKYQRHILHANGTWTWIGSVSTVHGAQSVVLTFGKHAMFGSIPQASGWPLEISTAHGQTRIMATSTQALARSTAWLRLHSKPDAVIPPLSVRMNSASSAKPVAAASESSPVTIDVLVAYTPGFVTVYGGASTALARIQFLVDWTNQAYVNSQIYQQIRLVHTVEVDYPDNNSDTDALYDLTGSNSSGPVPIPASLQGIASLRTQYGADLVSLIRPFDAAADAANECGVGWLDGIDESVPDAAFGYSVVSDKADTTITDGYYCGTNTFAHELGHNMGDAHDRANSTSEGAYTYSYGYLGNGVDGFSTIMAYGSATDTPLQVFSNPNISTCQNLPCGVPDSSTDSADNAHSMNNTAATIAAFEPTEVGNPMSGYVHDDVNGDGKSDLFWFNAGTGEITYWLMDGAQRTSWRGFFTSSLGYQPVAFGDFNGDGRADILWDNSSNHKVYMWLSHSNGSFSSWYIVTHRAGSSIAGTGDVNGDGKSDIIWFIPATHQFTYWLMNGPTRQTWRAFSIPADYRFAGIGDFNGDGCADILWADSNRHVYMWLNNGSGWFGSHLINTHQPGWAVAGVGDVNGDGKSDIFWYNQTAGQLTYWLMNGDQMTSWEGFNVSNVNHVAGIGDYNGDGQADVLWNQPGSRELWMWLDNRSGGFHSHFITYYSSSFVPVN